MHVSVSLCRRLAIRHPIFQAPAGGSVTPELAAAVSNAGGLGHLTCTWKSLADLRRSLDETSRLTPHPFGANFVLDFPIDDKLAMALDHGVRVISFFWGDPTRLVPRVRAAGAFAIQQVGSVDEAKRAADAGVDAIVAQGWEAGGHVRGEVTTFALVPRVVDAVAPLPVVAAGGIADRRGVAAALALGAAGAWAGTRFLASREAAAHSVYQDFLVAASEGDTTYSELFDIGWPRAPLRTLRNSTVRDWEAAGRPAAPNRPGEGTPVAMRGAGRKFVRYGFESPTRDVTGNVEAMAIYAGQGVGLIRAVQPAAEIVSELAAGVRIAALADEVRVE